MVKLYQVSKILDDVGLSSRGDFSVRNLGRSSDLVSILTYVKSTDVQGVRSEHLTNALLTVEGIKHNVNLSNSEALRTMLSDLNDQGYIERIPIHDEQFTHKSRYFLTAKGQEAADMFLALTSVLRPRAHEIVVENTAQVATFGIL